MFPGAASTDKSHDMDAHRLISMLVAVAGTLTALAGACIAALGIRVRVRAASRRHDYVA
jgi:hypothetical protein